MSIAWSVTEHLHDRIGCKTVFATHYHELTQLTDELVAVRNYNVSVQEAGERIVFLHRLEPGGADRSYGIDVGRLAGLPPAVIARAREILSRLEGEQLADAPATGDTPTLGRAPHAPAAPAPVEQLPLFAAGRPHPLVRRLFSIDADATTPLEALTLLAQLVADARREIDGVAPEVREG